MDFDYKKILDEVKNMDDQDDQEEVIYGVYNNKGKGLATRLNDFLIDHSRVTLKDKAYFFHLLGVMVDAGVPVVKGVKSLAKHADNHRFSRVLATIAYNVQAGATLTDAMTRFDDVFDESEIGIVKAGEASGKLNLMLKRLAIRLEKNHDLNMRLFGAAVYPVAVLCVLVIVAVAMLVWVLPTLLNLLEEGGLTGGELPFFTRVLIFIQKIVVNFWWLILILVFAGYGLFAMYRNTDKGSVKWDYRKLKIPMLGDLLRRVYVLRFIGMMGLLIESGLPVIKSLQISGNALTNKVYKLKIQESIEEVKVGKKISDSLGDTYFLFPHEVIQMLRVGESSANLASISEKISDQYQKEVDNSLKKLTALFEPLMILFVGLFVALLALAIMAPIFNLSSSVGA